MIWMVKNFYKQEYESYENIIRSNEIWLSKILNYGMYYYNQIVF